MYSNSDTREPNLRKDVHCYVHCWHHKEEAQHSPPPSWSSSRASMSSIVISVDHSRLVNSFLRCSTMDDATLSCKIKERVSLAVSNWAPSIKHSPSQYVSHWRNCNRDKYNRDGLCRLRFWSYIPKSNGLWEKSKSDNHEVDSMKEYKDNTVSHPIQFHLTVAVTTL